MRYGIADVEYFFKRTLQKTKYDAVNRRNLNFDLTTDCVIRMFFNQQGKCALTGWEMELERGGDFKNGKNPRVATMDRLDNNLGYVASNIQLTCAWPNFLKGGTNNDVFLDLCKLIVDHNFKK